MFSLFLAKRLHSIVIIIIITSSSTAAVVIIITSFPLPLELGPHRSDIEAAFKGQLRNSPMCVCG